MKIINTLGCSTKNSLKFNFAVIAFYIFAPCFSYAADASKFGKLCKISKIGQKNECLCVIDNDQIEFAIDQESFNAKQLFRIEGRKVEYEGKALKLNPENKAPFLSKGNDLELKDFFYFRGRNKSYEICPYQPIDAQEQYELAELYIKKYDDPANAQFWFEKASQNKHIEAKRKLEILIFCQCGVLPQVFGRLREHAIQPIKDKDTANKYGLKPTKGILLYGPPGTGKTFIAQYIGINIPNCVVSEVNANELRENGNGTKNIKKLFEPAKKNPDKFYIIIFDEIDAIGAKRTWCESNKNVDADLSFLLTQIDGMGSSNNVLVVGVTNNKDVLDAALIRAGRLETHIFVPHLNESERKKILEILVEPLKSKNLLDNDVNIDEWAKILDNSSAAEIKRVIDDGKRLAAFRYNISRINHKILMEAYEERENIEEYKEPSEQKTNKTIKRPVYSFPSKDNCKGISKKNSAKLHSGPSKANRISDDNEDLKRKADASENIDDRDRKKQCLETSNGSYCNWFLNFFRQI
jgi:ATPase family protein associated with various cellular activities (AAA)